MLRKEAVSPLLLETLHALMKMKTTNTHRLVDGTALALQLGHRISVDIDLFSDEKNNYDKILEELEEKFRDNFAKGRNVSNAFCKGVTVSLHNIKTDILDWNVKFIRPVFKDEHVRMTSKDDIIPMKFNTFLCAAEFVRYEKKDYVDIANLLKEYSFEAMIKLYIEKYPNEFMSSRLMIEVCN